MIAAITAPTKSNVKSCVPLARDATHKEANEATDTNMKYGGLSLWDHLVSISKETATTPAKKRKESPTMDEKLDIITDDLKTIKLDSSYDEVFIDEPSVQPQNVLATHPKNCSQVMPTNPTISAPTQPKSQDQPYDPALPSSVRDGNVSPLRESVSRPSSVTFPLDASFPSKARKLDGSTDARD